MQGLGKRVQATYFRTYMTRGVKGMKGIGLVKGDQLAVCKLVCLPL